MNDRTPKPPRPPSAPASLQSTLPSPTGRFRGARHPDVWQQIPDEGETIERLKTDLRDTLNSQNLVVLTGLGTSLCVTDDGQRLAPTMADLWAAAKVKAGDDFEHVLTTVKYEAAAATDTDGQEEENIELLLSRCMMAEHILNDPKITQFIKDTEELILASVDFLKPERRLEYHEAFLRKLGRRATGRPRLKLFTTNYDLCFEQAAGAARFIPVDGFSFLPPHVFDGIYFDYDFVRKTPGRETNEPVPNVVHFFKLHGSLNWRNNIAGQTVRNLGAGKPVIIYPRDSKFESSYQQPFLEMMARFQAALREPNTGLLICGFGFNDPHLVEPIITALRSNVSLRLVIANPVIEKTKSRALQWVQNLVEQGDHRITLLEITFERLVSLIPDLVTKTEAELHFERITPTDTP